MANTIILLSIKPEYANKIFDGMKVVELRRIRPKLEEGDLVIVYASSPKKALIGAFEVEKVVQKPLLELWKEVKEIAGISYKEFRSYYKGLSVGCGIYLNKTHHFSQPIELERLRQEWNNFQPPQSYRYLKPSEVNFVESITQFNIGEFATFYQMTLNVF
ncbi:ASCH domain-containing protein [Aliterella atlantica]|uniref:ASCH domain-containing protein n=1 Tax=Aliterella atlantica TaxID=1827278 RepID=UPI0005D31ACE|nr:ASCH domain-containing protein [Aliterella atlantica]